VGPGLLRSLIFFNLPNISSRTMALGFTQTTAERVPENVFGEESAAGS
jgi:hypothetical protein